MVQSYLNEKRVARVGKVRMLRMQYPRFLETTALRISNDLILKKIKSRMSQWKYSQKIIDATFIEIVKIQENGVILLAVESAYTSDTGFDVSTGREVGTVAVFVKPVFKKALRWITKAIVFFSRGHLRKGIFGSDIIDITVEEMLPEVQIKLDSETDVLVNKILKS